MVSLTTWMLTASAFWRMIEWDTFSGIVEPSYCLSGPLCWKKNTMKDNAWKLNVASGVRWTVLLFVLTVLAGIGSQRHLLTGVSPHELSLALMAVIIPVTPIFITMGFLLNEEQSETQAGF
jgi:hypothetical protein